MKLVNGTFLMFTLFFFGCQKEAAELHSEMGILTFNLALDSMPISETRTASTDADLKTYGFYLAGYHTEGNMNNSVANAYPNVFDHNTSDAQAPVPLVKLVTNKFTLKTIKWTLDETTCLSFFGWSQSKTIPTSGVSSAMTGIIAQTISATDKGYPWLDIRNADAPEDQTDVVGSRSINHPNDAVISAVDLDFRHLLSKLTFKAKSSSKANVTFTAVNIKYAASKVYKKARYTFGSDAAMLGTYGSFAEYHTGTVALNTSYPAMTNGGEVTLGSGLLLPQPLADGDVSLEVKYKLSPNSGALSGVEQTKTLPLAAFAFAQGKNYVYTIDVQATEIITMPAPSIEPWVASGTSMPTVPGPKDDVLLLLDGYDKPYEHTDGKKYWLDRSGYNRHVVLGAGVTYDGAKHGYVFKKGTVGGVIPSMGTVSGLTVDLVTEGTGTTVDQQPFKIGSYYLQLPYDTTQVDWNYPGSHIRWTAPSRADIDKLSFWSVTYGSTSTRIYYNAALKAEKSPTPPAQNITSNTLAPSYDGRISYLKVTAAERNVKEIVFDYQECAKRFKIVEPVSNYLPPVTDGLVFCFDGRSGVETINNVTYWREQVGKNDAKVIGTVPYTNKHFTVDGANYLTMIYRVAMSNDYTIEIVLRPNGKYEGQPIFWGTSTTEGSAGRIIALHFPYSDTSGTIYVDAPGGADRYNSTGWLSSFGGMTIVRQIAIRRQYTINKSEFFMYNRVALSGRAGIDISAKECTIMDMGGHNWIGDFYAVRFYNRALTDAEMARNYQFDKTNYGFTDDK